MLFDPTESAVQTVRAIKQFFGLFSGTTVRGIPLDWPVRFVALGLLYLLLAHQLKGRTAAKLCVLLLFGSELLEIFTTQSARRFHWPDSGDAADLIFGLAGIVLAIGLRYLFERRRMRNQAS